jgi:hypothetical protein
VESDPRELIARICRAAAAPEPHAVDEAIERM